MQVTCKIFLKSLYTFKVSQGRKWNFNCKDFGHMLVRQQVLGRFYFLCRSTHTLNVEGEKSDS